MNGFKVREGDYRCSDCVDFSAYERETYAGFQNDDNERCTYCGGSVVAKPAPVKRLTRRERHAQQMADMRARMANRPKVERTPERGAAYVQYISDGLADTDGYFAPLDFDSWAYSTAA